MTTMSVEGHRSAARALEPGVADGGYHLELDEGRFVAGERGELSFRVVGPDGVVTDFAEEHGAPLHLILVRGDLSGFQHLHPRMGADGTFSAALLLREPGPYRAFADVRTAGLELTLAADLSVDGRFDPRPLPAPQAVASADGYEVTKAGGGEAGLLTFTVRHGGEPVTDLQPYLGARGHLVAIRAGDLAYAHVHPAPSGSSDPTIAFHAELAAAGTYRLFLQFRHRDGVRTVAFTEEVPK